MTLPAYKAIGTGHDTTPAWPTHAAGDFGLLVTESDVTTISTPSGWTAVNGFPVVQGTGNNTILHVFYRFATSASETSPSISGTDHSYGVIITFTGVNTSNPVHAISTHTKLSNTTQSCPGLTTYLNDCMVVALSTWHLDNAGPLSSGEANSSLGSVTERFDGGTTTGNGGGLVIITGTLATKGTIGPTTYTLSSGAACAVACLALQAADQTFGVKSQIVNRGDQHMPIQVKLDADQTVDVWMADSSDGKTGKTGLTLAVTLKKYGQTSFSSISPTVTETGSGHYDVALTTSGGANHTHTMGVLSLRATSTGADPADCNNMCEVQAADKSDGVRLGLTALPNAAAEAAGGLITNGTSTGQLSVSGGRAKADTVYWNAAAVSVPTNAGVPNVNAKTWNDLATVALPLVPTTAGRTLDVSAGGEAGVDWANVGSPTTAVDLSGTTIKTATDVETDTADIQSRLPAALVSGRMDASAGAIAANAITAAATAADFGTEVAAAVMGSTVEGTATLVQIARLLTSFLGCPVTDFTTDTLVFKSLDGLKTRATVVLDTAGGTGRLSITLGDLT